MEDLNSELEAMVSSSNTGNAEKGQVIVAKILDTRNPEVVQLQCEQIVKGAEQSSLGFFMKGYNGITDERKRVAFQTVSTAFVEEYGIVEGCDLAEKMDRECHIVVKEGFIPRKWKDANGQTKTQSPKIKPSHASVVKDESGKVTSYGDDAVLKQGGKPIYREATLSIDMAEMDVFIKHDVEESTETAGVVNTNAETLTA